MFLQGVLGFLGIRIVGFRVIQHYRVCKGLGLAFGVSSEALRFRV